MRKSAIQMVLLVFCSFYLNGQDLNGYKYIVVEEEMYENGWYDIWDISKNLRESFEETGFMVLRNGPKLEKELKQNPCLVLDILIDHAEKHSKGADGRIMLGFQNCNNDIIYRMKVTGAGPSYKVSLRSATKKLCNKIKKLEYSYDPSESLIDYSLIADQDVRNTVEKNELTQNSKFIENSAVVYSDVDIGIPTTKTVKANAYALVIGNEDYTSRQTGLTSEQNVDFAENDAKIFASYCEQTIGIPKKQIKLLINATAAEIGRGLSWINTLSKIEDGNAELFFYYSGHGLPDEVTRAAYIIPVDVSGSTLDYAIKLSDVYKELTDNPAKKITVFMDACFSGGGRNKGLVSVKGVKVKPKEDILTNNIIIFSSSTGEESSGVYSAKYHGYFTYFLLKKIKETKGDVDYNSLGNYLIKSVKKESALSGKIQTPQVAFSPTIYDDWKDWNFN